MLYRPVVSWPRPGRPRRTEGHPRWFRPCGHRGLARSVRGRGPLGGQSLSGWPRLIAEARSILPDPLDRSVPALIALVLAAPCWPRDGAPPVAPRGQASASRPLPSPAARTPRQSPEQTAAPDLLLGGRSDCDDAGRLLQAIDPRCSRASRTPAAGPNGRHAETRRSSRGFWCDHARRQPCVFLARDSRRSMSPSRGVPSRVGFLTSTTGRKRPLRPDGSTSLSALPRGRPPPGASSSAPSPLESTTIGGCPRGPGGRSLALTCHRLRDQRPVLVPLHVWCPRPSGCTVHRLRGALGAIVRRDFSGINPLRAATGCSGRC